MLGGLVLAWVALLSLAAFVAAGWDKAAARRGRKRVRESTLLGLALAGGSPGLALGMLAFRHKTRKAGFLLAFGGIVALHLALAWAWFR